MSKSIDEKISDFLGIDNEIIEVEAEEFIVAEQPKKQMTVSKESLKIDDDYEYARNNLKGLIENGKDVINNMMYLAKEMESPRAYEVAGQLIKTIADTNKDLLDLSKKVKDVKKDEVKDEKGVTNVSNTLFVGSTAELQKLIGKK
jgi:hypothetical protein